MPEKCIAFETAHEMRALIMFYVRNCVCLAIVLINNAKLVPFRVGPTDMVMVLALTSYDSLSLYLLHPMDGAKVCSESLARNKLDPNGLDNHVASEFATATRSYRNVGRASTAALLYQIMHSRSTMSLVGVVGAGNGIFHSKSALELSQSLLQKHQQQLAQYV